MKITDYNYIGSAIGNAYFSGVSYEELWNCVFISETPEQLDAAISATIRLKELSSKNEN
jgi:hypothetical protein